MSKWILSFTLILLTSTTALFAQTISGFVKDAGTHEPISDAQIISSKITVLTNKEGKFTLGPVKAGEKIAIRIMGYETTELILQAGRLSDSLRIYLKQSTINLSAVTIKARQRNYKLDSINLRKEYAQAFNYKAPGFSDMFITRDPGYRSPFPNVNPRSTASIVSLNVLQLFSLLGRKKNSASRLKETLLRAEEANYVDQIFSKEKVAELTGLSGDSLSNFMLKYRPDRSRLAMMTGYEMVLYIKQCDKEFRKAGK